MRLLCVGKLSPLSTSLGTRPNQGGDHFQYPATRNCLGVQPLEFVLCPGTYGAGNEHINEIFEVLCADSHVHFAVSL